MTSHTTRQAAPLLQRAAAVAVWLAVWQALSLCVGARFVLAGPVETIRRLAELALTAPFWQSVGTTVAHVALSYIASFALGVILGLCAHARRWVSVLLAPLMSAIKSVPIACIVVLLLMLMGSRHVSAAVVALVVLPATYHATLGGLERGDTPEGTALRELRVSASVRVLAVVWPDLVGYLGASAASSVGMAWKAAVAAELIGMPLGSIGERVYQAKVLFETADLFAWTLAVIVLSAATERLFCWALRASAHASRRLAVRLSARPAGEGGTEPAPLELRGATMPHGDLAGKSLALVVRPGERVVLADPSGAGKTTLLRLAVAHADAWVVSSYQEPRLVGELDAVDNLVLACGAHVDKSELERRARTMVGDATTGTPCARLSGGERRRIDVLRALCSAGQAIVLDEPLSGLDAQAQMRVADAVDAYLGERPLVVASHAPDTSDLLKASTMTLGDVCGGASGDISATK